MTTILWHRTSAVAAAAVLKDGFRDGEGHYLTDRVWRGVWLSDFPMSPADGDGRGGTLGPSLLRIRFRGTKRELSQYEWKEEGKPYREWLVPAAIVNARSTIERAMECINCDWIGVAGTCASAHARTASTRSKSREQGKTMGRPATGSARWLEEKKMWIARITKPSGERLPVPMRAIPPCTVNPTAPKNKCPCAPCSQARWVAKELSDDYRKQGVVSASVVETSNEWHARYVERHAELGLETRNMPGAWKRWLGDVIGTLPMKEVTRAHIIKVRNALTAAVEKDEISAKRAMNMWSEIVRAPFSRAFTDDDPRYSGVRVGPETDNPTSGVKPPVTKDQLDGDARERQPLYPYEFLQVLTCRRIPVEDRRKMVVATYSITRPQEHYAFRWTDCDWRAREIRIRRKLVFRSGEEVPGTKSDAGIREIPIHDNLMPLLERMHAASSSDGDRILPFTGSSRKLEKFSDTLREYLKLAGITRSELIDGTDDLLPFDWRSLRTTGITWHCMNGVDSYVLATWSGHKSPDVTWGSYIKRGPDLRKRHGEPFPPLPEELFKGLPSKGRVSVLGTCGSSDSATLESGRRDLKTPQERPQTSPADAPDAREQSPQSPVKTGAQATNASAPESTSEPPEVVTVETRNERAEHKPDEPVSMFSGDPDAELAKLVSTLIARGNIARARAVLEAYGAQHPVEKPAAQVLKLVKE